MPQIQVENLGFEYSQTPVLKDVNFSVAPSAFLAIAGPNGAGKSTLLNILAGALKPKHGRVRIDSKKVSSYSDKELAKQIAMVRQEFVPAFDFTVTETVLMSRTIHFGQMGFESRADRQITEDALEATDTTPLAKRRLNQISGGERQRVFIARALAQDTPILLLDEPTSFLDLRHQVGIYDLLKKMQLEKGKTIITITHDVNLAAQYCDQVLLLGADQSHHTGTPKEVFTADNLKNVFNVNGHFTNIGDRPFFLPIGKLANDQNETSQDTL